MDDLTVRQLALISGVTVRALHHYDDIGLLKPAWVGDNGYRYYGRGEMLRLQAILFHRELGVPLMEISELLEMERSDRIEVLLRHREKLVRGIKRFDHLIETIDRTVEHLKDGTTMANSELYKGFSSEKQAGYEAWLIEQYGDGVLEDIEASRGRFEKLTDDARAALMDELKSIEGVLVEAMNNDVQPESASLDGVLAMHRKWVAQMWGKACSYEAYAGLGGLYRSHPDFVARYEQLGEGFTDWMVEAMGAYVDRNLMA